MENVLRQLMNPARGCRPQTPLPGALPSDPRSLRIIIKLDRRYGYWELTDTCNCYAVSRAQLKKGITINGERNRLQVSFQPHLCVMFSGLYAYSMLLVNTLILSDKCMPYVYDVKCLNGFLSVHDLSSKSHVLPGNGKMLYVCDITMNE